MLSVFLVARIFCKTFYYYLLTILKPHSLKDLKQHWAINLMCDFGYSISVSGEPPAPGPMILVGNHISYLDIMLVMSVHPDVVFIAKKEVSKWPVIGVAAARAGTVFVDRSNSGDGRTKRRMIADALKKNSSQVVVFPSGTTALSESKAWKKGIFEIARENAIPVKLFKITYSPLRESAYVDDDNLLVQMHNIFRIKNKTATLTWMDQFDVTSAAETAERLRLKTI